MTYTPQQAADAQRRADQRLAGQPQRPFADQLEELHALGLAAAAKLQDALYLRDPVKAREMLFVALNHLQYAKTRWTDLLIRYAVTQRTAPPTVPLEQREPGRMSSPQLQPMPITEVRPHKGWWE